MRNDEVYVLGVSTAHASNLRGIDQIQSLMGHIRLADSTSARVAVQHRPLDTSAEAGKRCAQIGGILLDSQKV